MQREKLEEIRSKLPPMMTKAEEVVDKAVHLQPESTKPVGPVAHGVIDYLTAGTLIMAPAIVPFSTAAKTFSIVAGTSYLGLSLITRYPLGMLKLVPFTLHAVIEAGMGAMLLAAPTLFKEKEDKGSGLFFAAVGASVLGLWLLTNYRAVDDGRLPQRLSAR